MFSSVMIFLCRSAFISTKNYSFMKAVTFQNGHSDTQQCFLNLCLGRQGPRLTTLCLGSEGEVLQLYWKSFEA
jgi:hypothetical protein